MPFISDDLPENKTQVTPVSDAINEEAVQTLPETLDTEVTNPSFLETFGAAYDLHNPITNVGKWFGEKTVQLLIDEPDPNFEPSKQAEADNLSGKVLEEALKTESKAEYDRLLTRDREERKALKILENSSGFSNIVSSVIASAASPDMLLGAGTAIKAAKAGRSITGSAAITGAVTGGVVLGTEKLLQETQLHRTDEEVATNTIVATLFGTVFGAVGGAVGKYVAKSKQKSLLKNMQNSVDVNGSIGEAAPSTLEDLSKFDIAVKDMTKEQLSLRGDTKLNEFLGKGVRKFTKGFSPQLRLLEDPSISANRFAADMLDLSVDIKATRQGIALPESLEGVLKRKGDEAVLRTIEMDNTFKAYKEAGGTLKKREYDAELAKAIIKGTDDPFIAKGAKVHQDYTFDVAKTLKELDLLTEDVTVEQAARFLSRNMDIDKLKAHPEGFKKAQSNYIRKQLQKVEPRLKIQAKEKVNGEFTKEALEAQEDLKKHFGDNLEKYIKDSVNHTYNSYIGINSKAGINIPKSGKAGPLKARTNNIPDEDIMDYMDLDLPHITTKYSKQIEPVIEWKKRFGDTTIEDMKQAVVKDYNDLIDEATPKERVKLIKQLNNTLLDMDMQHDLVMGRYLDTDPNSTLSQASNVLMSHNYLVMLGQVMLTSLADFGNTIGAHGLGKTLTKGLPVYTKGLIKSIRGMPLEDQRALGQALETFSGTRARELWGAGNPMETTKGIAHFTSKVSKKASNVFGLNQHNDSMQAVSSYFNTNKLVNAIDEFVTTGKLNDRQESWLNSLGINKSSRKGIYDQMVKHGNFLDDRVLPNIDKWDDKVLKDKVTAGLGKQIDRELLTKGVSDVPAIANTTYGKVWLQFTNFSFAYWNKIVLSGIHRNDAMLAQTVVSTLGLGMMIGALKDTIKGKELPTTSEEWMREGLRSSGFTGVLALGEGISGGLGMSYERFKGERPKGDPGQKAAGALLGPTGSTLYKAGTVTGNVIQSMAGDRNLTKKDIHKLRTLIWFQNLFYTQSILDKVEEQVASGLPANNRKPSRKRRR